MENKNFTTKLRFDSLLKFVVSFISFALLSFSVGAFPLGVERVPFAVKPSEDTIAFYKTITANRAYKMIQEVAGNPQFVILDVRKPEDFLKEHIKDAINIDFKSSDFSKSLANLDKMKTYFVICYAGVRSKNTMLMMEKLNFRKVYNIKGGMMKWRAKKLPLVSI
jgi:phage shock protein E